MRVFSVNSAFASRIWGHIPKSLGNFVQRREEDVMKRTFGLLVLGCIVWDTPSLADPGRGATVLCYLWAHQPTPPLNTPYGGHLSVKGG
jgi:hypothetical protein